MSGLSIVESHLGSVVDYDADLDSLLPFVVDSVFKNFETTALIGSENEKEKEVHTTVIYGPAKCRICCCM